MTVVVSRVEFFDFESLDLQPDLLAAPTTRRALLLVVRGGLVVWRMRLCDLRHRTDRPALHLRVLPLQLLVQIRLSLRRLLQHQELLIF